MRTAEVTSVVHPVLRGKRYAATFRWVQFASRLIVDWPADAERPTIKLVPTELD